MTIETDVQCGRYRIRTCDPLGVSEVHYRCAKRPDRAGSPLHGLLLWVYSFLWQGFLIDFLNEFQVHRQFRTGNHWKFTAETSQEASAF
jgi:hypothetical protein